MSQYCSRSNIELFAVYLSIFCVSFVSTSIIPLANDMVMSFGITDDRNKTGTWAGLILTSLMLGRVISSPIWGYIMDSWGRRPVTLLALACTAFFSICFGMTTNIISCLFIRFLLGATSPLMVTGKTLVSELCKGEKVSSAMALLLQFWNVGYILASFTGGILANPVKKGWFESDFFETFPFFLPFFISGLICIFSFVLSYYYLRETLVKVQENTFIDRPQRSIFKIITDRKVFPIIVVYVIMYFNAAASIEAITLLLWARKDTGGFEMSVQEIGYMIGCSNLFILLFQRQFYMYFVHRYGNYIVCIYGLTFLAIVNAIIPFVSVIENTYVTFCLLFILCITFNMLEFMISSSILVMQNNSVPPHELGRLNGTTSSLASFARSFAPALTGLYFHQQ
ncbi:hypothetical protein SteCoe_12140 [Stentor coeruleus]|uniref:Major facilitator superfamily (MFS) profile domain-containing protein n=1 Tax=Stentor coeruleus TaxID=5963 RepID=A0A1R2CBH5_9CILI|nr:hypothetical protein SteCoe_12140 [Stentor coeruleus]